MHHETLAEDKIPLLQKLAYAVGMFVNNLQAAAIPAMAVILNLGLGVDPILVGIIAFAPRIFDAVTDPLMGYISDNTNTRWGRRRPFIFVGALLAGAVFAAMWQLPTENHRFFFWAFLAASILYYSVYTLFATPFVAFGYEMTPDYHERTRLHTIANIVGQLPWLAVPWFYALIENKDLFASDVEGARAFALVVGTGICLLGIVPAIFCREKKYSPMKQIAQESPLQASLLGRTLDFFAGIKATFQCRPFVKLCAATFLVFGGYQLGNSFTFYVLIYYVFDFNKDQAVILMGGFGTLTSAVSFFLVIPCTGWVATRIGKRQTFMAAIAISLIGYGLKWFGYNPNHPNWLLASCPFIAFGIGSLFTLMGSMISDVCDYDELSSQQRREGLFAAVYWWMVKVGAAIAGLLTGILLKTSGFAVELLADQSERTLLLLRVFDVGVPLVTSAIALWIIARYEITEAETWRIRQELEQRRGKLR